MVTKRTLCDPALLGNALSHYFLPESMRHIRRMTPRELLQALLDRDGLNSNSLAARVGKPAVSQPKIHKFLSGVTKEPRKDFVEGLAAFYRVSPEAFRSDAGATKAYAQLFTTSKISTGENKSDEIAGDPVNVAASSPVDEGFPLSIGRRTVDKTPFHKAPVVRWPRRGEVLNSSTRLVGRMAIIPGSYSEATQIVQVAESAMRPEIEEGEFIAIDPHIPARNGDIVVVRDRIGDYHLRKYRRVIGDEFEAWASNPDYATLTSQSHGLLVAGVMVCHLRVRQP